MKRDKKRGKPYARTATDRLYKEKIHTAIIDNGQFDPFTGDALDWKLIATWDTSTTHGNDGSYRKKFALMPTVDHIDPDLLEFEICSWLTNDCKSYLNPAEFVTLCKRIANYRKTSAYIKKWLRLKKTHK